MKAGSIREVTFHSVLEGLYHDGVSNEAVDIIQDRKWFPQGSASPLPFSPSGLSATRSSGTDVELAWTDNSSNESGFKIERKKTSGSYAQISTVGAGTSRYTDKGAAESAVYTYRVKAYNAAGDSGYSNEATVARFVSAPSKSVTPCAWSARLKFSSASSAALRRLEISSPPGVT